MNNEKKSGANIKTQIKIIVALLTRRYYETSQRRRLNNGVEQMTEVLEELQAVVSTDLRRKLPPVREESQPPIEKASSNSFCISHHSKIALQPKKLDTK
ncbi:hypothetical protein Zmor_004396 [Zophobas morio]|uniref:Uncharacterized protein n=1 Tax=Zophobas morio TaxID=2755281 RepID=A0AA38M103_9CUCU|nr:hypothetical protein Zmor_004396 [Zophobas morio]